MKYRMEGFQKQTKRDRVPKEVRVAVISYQSDGSVVCSCGGWTYRHIRRKVTEDAIDKHITKRHNGMGFRL